MRLTIISIFVFIVINVNAQITFNKRMDFDRSTSTILTNVEVTDSCYYVCGVAVDTVFPYRQGTLFSKIDLDGEVVWYKAMNDSLASFSILNHSLSKTEEGDFIVMGYGIDAVSMAALLMKFSPQGDIIFTKKYRSPYFPDNSFMSLRDGIQTDDEGFILSSNITNPNISTDISLIKTNSIGELEWDTIYGNLDWSENIETPSPSQQAWIVKVDQHGCLVPGCHLIDNIEEPVLDLQVRLYPNPTTDYLNVFYYHPNHRGRTNFRIVDLRGQVVQSFSSTINNVTLMISVSDLPVGQYFLKVENTDGEVVTKGFVKQ